MDVRFGAYGRVGEVSIYQAVDAHGMASIPRPTLWFLLTPCVLFCQRASTERGSQ